MANQINITFRVDGKLIPELIKNLDIIEEALEVLELETGEKEQITALIERAAKRRIRRDYILR